MSLGDSSGSPGGEAGPIARSRVARHLGGRGPAQPLRRRQDVESHSCGTASKRARDGYFGPSGPRCSYGNQRRPAGAWPGVLRWRKSSCGAHNEAQFPIQDGGNYCGRGPAANTAAATIDPRCPTRGGLTPISP
ncbi:hypothetical protein NDU88_002173 [Pleurodeles waltl]|uniref:Uncharacterized protein n=1 Tax=Pleurodeles waltl TaxID=8319 RepID=A0AAV7U8N3_PLEWA|nr:hypothetical protein NDU88_002173 [Pleurodeles waltl]